MKSSVLLASALVVTTGAVLASTDPLGGPAPAGAARSVDRTDPPLDLLVVRFTPDATATERSNALASAGTSAVGAPLPGHRVVVRGNAAVAANLRAASGVAAVWQERLRSARHIDGGFPRSAAWKDRPPSAPPQAAPYAPPDPWHDLDAFNDENAPGVWQWEDDRQHVQQAWTTTIGDPAVKVAVIDAGVNGEHGELMATYEDADDPVTIPCNELVRQYGPLGRMDCSTTDTSGHGTWIAGRIAGAVNGRASNGIAPGVRVTGYKAVSTSLDAFASSWVVTAMVRACDAGADLLNLSLGVYLDPVVDAEEYLMWVETVEYCRGKGTALIAAAGNDHVRINRVDAVIGGEALVGVGQVDSGDEGFALVFPGDPIEPYDLRGTLLAPGGVPGVVMVSATNNAVGAPASLAAKDRLATHPSWTDELTDGNGRVVEATDQLAYYSNYGSRVDVAASGGARKFNIPAYDGGYEDVLYGGWGQVGPLTANGALCRVDGDLLFFACFKDGNDAYGWLQGTSISTADAAGIAALALSAHPALRGEPDALLAHLQATARDGMVNRTGVNAPDDLRADIFGSVCPTGYCYTDFSVPIPFADAYGAGLLDANAAVTTLLTS